MVVRFLMSKFYEELMTKWRCHSNQACDSSSLLSYFKDFTVALSQWQRLSVLSTSVSIAVFLTDQYPSLPHCIFFLWGAFVLCNPFKSSCFVHEKWNRGFDKIMSIFLKWVNFQIYFSYELRIVASVQNTKTVIHQSTEYLIERSQTQERLQSKLYWLTGKQVILQMM